MAKWWLLNVQFPEQSQVEVLQIYAETPEMARTAAESWLHSGGVLGPQERVSVTIRGSNDQPYSNQMITSTGIKDPPGRGVDEEPPPDGVDTLPDGGGDPTGLEETEPRAAFLRAMAGRGVDSNTIMGRAQTGNQPFSDYLNTFNFGSLLQGFNPLGTPENANTTRYGQTIGKDAASLDKFQQFTRVRDQAGVRQSAANVLSDLLSAQPVGGLSQTLPTLRGQFGQPSEGQAGVLAELAKTALAAGISPLALQYLRLPSGSDLRDRFLAEGQGGSFLDYFKQQYPMLAGL